jgi:hypothetical protein
LKKLDKREQQIIKKTMPSGEEREHWGTDVSVNSPSESFDHSHKLFLALYMTKCSAHWGLKEGVKKKHGRGRKKKLYMDTNLTIWRLKREEDQMKTEMIRD